MVQFLVSLLKIHNFANKVKKLCLKLLFVKSLSLWLVSTLLLPLLLSKATLLKVDAREKEALEKVMGKTLNILHYFHFGQVASDLCGMYFIVVCCLYIAL